MSCVYIVRAVGTGKIKVGVTTDLDRRLSEIRALCPVDIEIVRVIEGVERGVESDIHALLREYHSHNEWFYEDRALELALHWAGIVDSTASDIAAFIYRHIPPEEMRKLILLLHAAGAANIANELTNLIDQPIMDRRYSA